MQAGATQDILSGTTCEIVPWTDPWGPGFYLVAENDRVEAGPFRSYAAALRAMGWLEDNARGVHPGPWTTRWSSQGLLIGSRIRDRRKLFA